VGKMAGDDHARSDAMAPALQPLDRSPVQVNFGRTWRMTLKLSGTYSSCSETSSPKWRRPPPQSGQQSRPGL
jgi:hypothetical protein